MATVDLAPDMLTPQRHRTEDEAKAAAKAEREQRRAARATVWACARGPRDAVVLLDVLGLGVA